MAIRKDVATALVYAACTSSNGCEQFQRFLPIQPNLVHALLQIPNILGANAAGGIGFFRAGERNYSNLCVEGRRRAHDHYFQSGILSNVNHGIAGFLLANGASNADGDEGILRKDILRERLYGRYHGSAEGYVLHNRYCHRRISSQCSVNLKVKQAPIP